MAPQQDDSFKEDMKAWARLFYFEENGEFQGRLEVVKELHTLMQSPPTETTTQDPNLWAEKWNQVMWGAQYELDMAEAKAVATAKSQAVISGKGLQLGKGKRHWSNAAIHTNYYEPFPFHLSLVVVESVYYSWDELCDKFEAGAQSGRLQHFDGAGEATSTSGCRPFKPGLCRDHNALSSLNRTGPSDRQRERSRPR